MSSSVGGAGEEEEGVPVSSRPIRLRVVGIPSASTLALRSAVTTLCITRLETL